MQISLDRVSVQFSIPEGGTLHAVGPVSFDVEAGSFLALVGPSGSGKSTLVKAIAGLQVPSSGQIRLDNEVITKPHDRVGMMFQDATLMPWRSVHDNIRLPLEINRLSQKQQDARVQALLPLLGLAEFGAAYPGELSGGMAQRVALGRALIQQPQVLLLDEPFGALDAITREKISLDLLRIWSQFQQTIVMVTHDINESVLLSDRVIVLSNRPGRVIAEIDIPLARPRTLEMIYTQPFIESSREVRRAINRA